MFYFRGGKYLQQIINSALDLLNILLYTFERSKKRIERTIMDDADSSDADRSNICCKLNIVNIGITCV